MMVSSYCSCTYRVWSILIHAGNVQGCGHAHGHLSCMQEIHPMQEMWITCHQSCTSTSTSTGKCTGNFSLGCIKSCDGILNYWCKFSKWSVRNFSRNFPSLEIYKQTIEELTWVRFHTKFMHVHEHLEASNRQNGCL